VTRFRFGWIRRSVRSLSLVTQTLPAPKASPYELKPILMRAWSFPVRGLMRVRRLRERSETQMLRAPYASPNGFWPTLIRFATAFDAGSTPTARGMTRSVVHTEPAAESTIPEEAPILIFATGSGAAAADAITAAATTAAATSIRP